MKNFTIEVLYPEFNNLYGDRGNLMYLTKKLSLSGFTVKIINTNLFETPSFVNKNIDFLYIGPSTENNQILQLKKLSEYAKAVEDRIFSNRLTFASGNALELFGNYIEDENNNQYEALALFDFYATRFSDLRYNNHIKGTVTQDGFESTIVAGFQNQLSHSHGKAFCTLDNSESIFLENLSDTNKDIKDDVIGVLKNGFLATYLLGPFLALNPEFFKFYLTNYLGDFYSDNTLDFELEAHKTRINSIL